MTRSDDLPEWLTSTRPVNVNGKSGGGKTTFARAVSHLYPGPSIYYDLDEEPDMGVPVHTVDELHEALCAGETRICFRTATEEVVEPESFEAVVRYLIRLGDELRDEPGNPSMAFHFDELQDLPLKWVLVAFKRLRKRLIKPMGYSQDPVSVPKRVRTQAEWNVWLSPPNSEMMDSLAGMGWPEDLLAGLNDFDALVLGDNWEPLERWRAPEAYVRE